MNFIIDRDPTGYFKFSALQSQFAVDILQGQEIDLNKMESFIFYENGRVYQRSRAALEIARRMNGLWPLMYVIILIPGFIRDLIYNLVARNRYKWFGKRETCRIPTPDLKSRFIDS